MEYLSERFDQFFAWFWSERIWLPEITNWEKVKALKNPQAVALGDIYLCIPVAVVLIILRIIFENFIARPIVKFLGVKEKKPVKIRESDLCEQVYRKSRKPNKEQIQDLSSRLGWSTQEVEKWFRRRPAKYNLSPMRKATESSWRFFFYLTATIYGFIVIVYKENWLWNLDECFKDFNSHVISMELYFYYVAELGMYISLSFSQFTDVKRKDFWQHMVHHASTIALLLYSYIAGYHRIGAVIVFVHDISDIFLEGAKVFHYAKLQKICDVLFGLLTLTFFGSRLMILPFWVLPACFTTATKYVGDFLVYRIMLGLLLVLQTLHIYWAKCILTIAIGAVTGKGVEDVRSDEEYFTEDENHKKPAVKEEVPANEVKKIQ
ncbi:ceramide synthase 5 [Nematostella vectensis]|uniref:ceramide synthase 5 n=1 Tax=Nematostella vectensis TaxID=45351 RepID=UPI00138FA629|nr:ceramide synthase 5 [Nematostella vectensis]XP_032236951.1 ceramide synthase 5 [Nematostella vectensis]